MIRGIVLLPLAMALGCRPTGPIRPHEVLTPDGEPLRTAFNADSGEVRAIVLASPT